jgi:hypothetical protein
MEPEEILASGARDFITEFEFNSQNTCAGPIQCFGKQVGEFSKARLSRLLID